MSITGKGRNYEGLGMIRQLKKNLEVTESLLVRVKSLTLRPYVSLFGERTILYTLRKSNPGSGDGERVWSEKEDRGNKLHKSGPSFPL